MPVRVPRVSGQGDSDSSGGSTLARVVFVLFAVAAIALGIWNSNARQESPDPRHRTARWVRRKADTEQ